MKESKNEREEIIRADALTVDALALSAWRGLGPSRRQKRV